MQLSEEDADAIKIQLIQNFSESGAGLGTFVALILKMDNVINYPLEFVDMLPKIKLTPKIDPEITKRYEKLINKTIEMGDILRSTIKNLRDNTDVVFQNTTKIHELENEIERAVALAGKVEPISVELLSEKLKMPVSRQVRPLAESVKTLEIDLIRRALEECNGKKTAAAKKLGISREGLRKKLARYEIT